MSFIFGFLNALLTSIMLFDTLGLIYQFRKGSVDQKEFNRVWFSWMLFLAISSLFSCSWKGFFGTLIRLIIFLAKVYVTIPIFGGSLKIHKYLIEDGKALQFYNTTVETVKSKICKEGKCSYRQYSSTDCVSETLEPENDPQGGENVLEEEQK